MKVYYRDAFCQYFLMNRNVWTVNLDQLNAFLLRNSIHLFKNAKILLTLNFWTMVYMYILNKKWQWTRKVRKNTIMSSIMSCFSCQVFFYLVTFGLLVSIDVSILSFDISLSVSLCHCMFPTSFCMAGNLTWRRNSVVPAAKPLNALRSRQLPLTHWHLWCPQTSPLHSYLSP